jgi:predicted proteasome-type protease
MKFILFLNLLFSGQIASDSDNLYTLYANGEVYEHACYGEVMNFIETNEFAYDDNLCECGELE